MTHFEFNCGSGPEHGHETALEMVSGAYFGFRTIFRIRSVAKGLVAKLVRKPAKHKIANYFCSKRCAGTAAHHHGASAGVGAGIGVGAGVGAGASAYYY